MSLSLPYRPNGIRALCETVSAIHLVTNAIAFSALYEESCLFLVPGSHALPRSAEQRALSSTMDPPMNAMDMSGAIQVTLKRK